MITTRTNLRALLLAGIAALGFAWWNYASSPTPAPKTVEEWSQAEAERQKGYNEASDKYWSQKGPGAREAYETSIRPEVAERERRAQVRENMRAKYPDWKIEQMVRMSANVEGYMTYCGPIKSGTGNILTLLDAFPDKASSARQWVDHALATLGNYEYCSMVGKWLDRDGALG